MARKRPEPNPTADMDHLYFPPERVVRLLVGLKSSIGLAESRAISIEDLEMFSGRPMGTIGSWFEGARMNQLEFLFSLLERVPPRLRHELLDGTCRPQPTIGHAKLAHDPIAATQLESVLQKRAGVSVICGGPKHARAFLLNALGNSSRQVNSGQQCVVGVDAEPASVWVPVPGVIHLPPHADIGQQFQRAWSKIKHTDDGSLILLGSVWNRVSQLHAEILQSAARCHVVVSDEFTKLEHLVRRVPGTVHILTVALSREQPEWIKVTTQVG